MRDNYSYPATKVMMTRKTNSHLQVPEKIPRDTRLSSSEQRCEAGVLQTLRLPSPETVSRAAPCPCLLGALYQRLSGLVKGLWKPSLLLADQRLPAWSLT